jgi:hypothetical protein
MPCVEEGRLAILKRKGRNSFGRSDAGSTSGLWHRLCNMSDHQRVGRVFKLLVSLLQFTNRDHLVAILFTVLSPDVPSPFAANARSIIGVDGDLPQPA